MESSESAAAVAVAVATNEKPRVSKSIGRSMSKSTYSELLCIIARLTTSQSQESQENMEREIQELFNFDPIATNSVYNKEATYRYRKKKSEQGISTYVSSGKKSSDQKKRLARAAAEAITA